ncbi:MAG: DUF998 domain-containing protein [Thaumarchaeota archaeon]|nr:DUF998 domain-containing protein [Nitrososphaerota archaeon]
MTGWTSNARLAGSFLLAGGIVNILMNTIAEGTYPGYSVGKNALSDLGALGSPTAFLWNSMLLATSLLLIAGIVMFFRSKALDIPRRGATGVLFVLPAVGLTLVSLFPENLIPPSISLAH